MFCGRSTSPLVTDAFPLVLNAVTLLVLQLPVPCRGVERLPLIVVFDPLALRLPLVPTFPPYASNVDGGVAIPPEVASIEEL